MLHGQNYSQWGLTFINSFKANMTSLHMCHSVEPLEANIYMVTPSFKKLLVMCLKITCQASQSIWRGTVQKANIKPANTGISLAIPARCFVLLAVLASDYQPPGKQVPNKCQPSTTQLTDSIKQMEIAWRKWCCRTHCVFPHSTNMTNITY